MKPEDQARVAIDANLAAAGWVVQDAADLEIDAALGVVARSLRLGTQEADHLLYVEGKAIGGVEAKKLGSTLTGVEPQSARYASGLPRGVQTHRDPLPFSYESTGAQTRFTNHLDPDPRSRDVFSFHRPEELLRLVRLDAQLRGRLRAMLAINAAGMWPVQLDTVRRLEAKLADNYPRSLVRMATGSGKTFTAVSALYRLVKFAGARRVLFLVDRNNLGTQARKEFEQYRSQYTNANFTDEYPVTHLRTNKIDPSAKVVITTIPRLYSILKGEPEHDDANDDSSSFADPPPLTKAPLPVVYNAAYPPEFFDFVVIDECHRSIYNLWKQVLTYFDAFLVGLTATATGQTVNFFNGNLVQNYDQTRAIADGVNVGFEVFRIETEVTKNGATIVREAGVFVPRRDRRTLKNDDRELDDDLTYTANMLDRDVVAVDQIRTVIRTLRDSLPQIFPGRGEVPKTLIFAKTDLHADDVVQVVREEFGKGNRFCEKITSKADDPAAMLKQFQNEHFPRVAVTVDMIATGTDVKPLECVVFLRNVKSRSYFEQMVGRGCRVATADEMGRVNHVGRAKTHFVIVDCVGVCESVKVEAKPLNRLPAVAFDKLLDYVAKGGCDADHVLTLGDRLARLDRQATPGQLAAVEKAADAPLATLVGTLLESVEPGRVADHAASKFGLHAGTAPTDAQLDEAEAELAFAAVMPFRVAAIRKAVLAVWKEVHDHWQTVDNVTQDTCLRAEFDPQAKENAAALVADFRAYLDESRGDSEALRLSSASPRAGGLRFEQLRELETAMRASPRRLDPVRVWHAYGVLEPATVALSGEKRTADLVPLVRHALDPATALVPAAQVVGERYADWLAEREPFPAEQHRWLTAMRDQVATSLHIDRDDLSDPPFYAMGGLGKAFALFGDGLDALLDELTARLQP